MQHRRRGPTHGERGRRHEVHCVAGSICSCDVDVCLTPSQRKHCPLLQDCHISPTAPLVASAQVSGMLRLFRYQLSDTMTCEAVATKTVTSAGSCRGVCFSDTGATLFAGTSDNALHAIDTETATMTAIDLEAHAVGINRVRAFESNSVCTGDDSGNLKVWDTRSKGVVYTYKKHTDFVTDIAFHSTSSSVVVTSGDGTLSVRPSAAPCDSPCACTGRRCSLRPPCRVGHAVRTSARHNGLRGLPCAAYTPCSHCTHLLAALHTWLLQLLAGGAGHRRGRVGGSATSACVTECV
jgi:hypothetical protein